MPMSNNKLIDLLSKKSSLSNEEVEEQLRELRDYISSELKKNQSCTLDGLGTFRMLKGELNFVPDDKLAMEINHTYAGMKPIELIGAYKEMSDEVATEGEGSKEISVPPIDSGVEKYQQQEESVTADERDDQEPKDEEKSEVPEIEAESESESEIAAEAEVEIDTESEERESASQPVEADDSGTEKEDTDIPPFEHESSEPSVVKKQEADDPIGKWLIAAVIVLAVGLGGWLVYDMGFFGNGDQQSVSSASTGQPVAQANPGAQDVGSDAGTKSNTDNVGNELPPTDTNEAGNEGTADSEQDGPNSISEDVRIAEESRQSVYGLRGGATPEARDGYTIVVHSLRDEAKVRRVNAELQQQGYRTFVFSASVLDTTFWRLGLGQFRTIEDALEAAATLPDIYRDNHFIKRIQ